MQPPWEEAKAQANLPPWEEAKAQANLPPWEEAKTNIEPMSSHIPEVNLQKQQGVSTLNYTGKKFGQKPEEFPETSAKLAQSAGNIISHGVKSGLASTAGLISNLSPEGDTIKLPDGRTIPNPNPVHEIAKEAKEYWTPSQKETESLNTVERLLSGAVSMGVQLPQFFGASKLAQPLGTAIKTFLGTQPVTKITAIANKIFPSIVEDAATFSMATGKPEEARTGAAFGAATGAFKNPIAKALSAASTGGGMTYLDTGDINAAAESAGSLGLFGVFQHYANKVMGSKTPQEKREFIKEKETLKKKGATEAEATIMAFDKTIPEVKTSQPVSPSGETAPTSETIKPTELNIVEIPPDPSGMFTHKNNKYRGTTSNGSVVITDSPEMTKKVMEHIEENTGNPIEPNIPQKLSEAVDKPNQVDVLNSMGVKDEKGQIEGIVNDAVKQKLTTADAYENKGDLKTAEALRVEARQNADKLLKADGVDTENAVNKALGEQKGKQELPTEPKPKTKSEGIVAGDTVKVGRSPQNWTVLEELKQTEIEKELGERYFKVKNAQGKVSTVELGDLKQVKAKVVSEKVKPVEAKEQPKGTTISLKSLEGRKTITEDELGRIYDVVSGKKSKADMTAILKEKGIDVVKAGPGGQTAGTVVRETPSDISQLKQALNAINKDSSISDKQSYIERIKQYANDIKDKTKSLFEAGEQRIEKLIAPPEHTDFKGILGDYLFERQRTSKETHDFAKDILKATSAIKREAIFNWIDAGGNDALLRDAEKFTTHRYKAGYREALKLTPEEKILAENIKNYYESRLDAAHKAGVPIGDIGENYINRLIDKNFNKARKLKAQINAGIFEKNPSILKQRIHETLLEGERAGVKYKKDVGLSLVAYDQAINDAIATRNALKGFLDNGKAKDGRPLATVVGGKTLTKDAMTGKTTGMAVKPRMTDEDSYDYLTVNHPAFRQWKMLGKDESGKPIYLDGEIRLHPDIAQHMKNILSKSAIRQQPVLKTIMKTASELKATLLSASGFHQVQVAKHGLDHWINPTLVPEIDFDNPITQIGVKNGMMLFDHDNRQMFEEGSGGAGLIGRLPFVGTKLRQYTQYTFGDYIPRLKNHLFKTAYERNIERYKDSTWGGRKLSENEIAEITANQVNAAFGELNYKWMGRSATVQDISRLTALAPDFLEARLRFAGQAVKPFGREQLYALARDAIGMYVGARALNAILNNGDTHTETPFSVVYKGKAYGVRSVVGDMYHLFSDARGFVYHRLNPYITRPILEAVTGRDAYGRKRATDQQIKDMLKNIVPIPAQGLVNKETQTLADSLLSAVGVTSYTDRSDAEKKVIEILSDNTPKKEITAENITNNRARKKVVNWLREGKDPADLPQDIKQTLRKFTPQQLSNMEKDSELTPLQASFNSNYVTAEDALKVWKVATEEEKEQIKDMFWKKVDNHYDKLQTQEEQDEFERKVRKIYQHK